MALKQRRPNRRQEERLFFETLLPNLLLRFVNVPADRVDAEIVDSQREICECLGLDVSALWQNESGSSSFLLTHLYRALDGPPVPDRMEAKDYFPWCMKLLQGGNVVVVSSVDSLPPEAARDVESWRHFGIKTSLTFPLSTGGGESFGFLSFNDVRRERDWRETVIRRMQLLAQVFAQALARRRADEALRENEERFRSIFEQAAVGIAQIAPEGRFLRVNDKLCKILGYSREELMQLSFQDITYPEDLDSGLNFSRQVLPDEIKTYSLEKRFIRKDRCLVWADLDVSLVRTESSKYFISVVEDITRRKQAEAERHELSGRLIQAQENERAWLAKELHDGLSQNLALLAVNLDQLWQHPPEKPTQVSKRMKELFTRVNELAQDVHRLSHGLHPSILETLGLVTALKSFCRELEHTKKLATHLIAHDVPPLPKEVALCLYRVVQEALQNVVKHSGAKQATIEIMVAGDEIHMCIADDGKGFDLSSKTTVDSIGLAGMRERIGLVHGEIQWETKPGQGTTVRVSVPISGPAKPGDGAI